MFKSEWEKAAQCHKLPEDLIAKMLSQAYPAEKLTSYEVIKGGCANLVELIELFNL